MKNALISAVVAALVASGGAYAGVKAFNPSSLVVAKGDIVSVAAGARGWASASCPLGSTATGGGLVSSDLGTGDAYVTDSAPAPISTRVAPNGWTVVARNPGLTPVEVQAYAVCVK